MSATSAKKPLSSKRSGAAKASAKPKASAQTKIARPDAQIKQAQPLQEQGAERVTKQERVLTLLSRAEGASLEEMMRATDWQKHSVRGFLAGTVKKKLGFQLTSSKAKDGVRRYHVAMRRGR